MRPRLELKQVRVVRRASGWYAMLVLRCEVSVPNVLPYGEPVGIGLEKFLATSTGKLIVRPRFLFHSTASLNRCNGK